MNVDKNVTKFLRNSLDETQTQIIDKTLVVGLGSKFGEMPSMEFVNKNGQDLTNGQVVYHKLKLVNTSDYDKERVGDLTKFNDASTERVQVLIDKMIEVPQKIFLNDFKMSGIDGLVSTVVENAAKAMALTAETTILKQEIKTAEDNLGIRPVPLSLVSTKQLQRFLDKQIAELRVKKDNNISSISLDDLIIKVTPEFYMILLDAQLIVNNGSSANMTSFENGKFYGRYKGVKIIEDVYFDGLTTTDGVPVLGSIQMIGSIAFPWNIIGVARDRVPGEIMNYLLNSQAQYGIETIYPNHIIVLTDKSPVLETDEMNAEFDELINKAILEDKNIVTDKNIKVTDKK